MKQLGANVRKFGIRQLCEFPLYDALYRNVDRHADIRRQFHTLPILERHHLKGLPASWTTQALTDAIGREDVEFTSSAGTSAPPLHIVREKNWRTDECRRTYRYNSRLREYRIDMDRKLIFAMTAGRENLDMEDRIEGATLYVNTTKNPNSWSRRDINRMSWEIDFWKPAYVDADPLYLATFIQKLQEYQCAGPSHRPEVLTLSYELCPSAARNVIKSFWDVPTFDLFGSAESGYLFVQDDRGMRRCPELSLVEYKPFDVARRLYRLVVTSTKNQFMPFVRYRNGDIVALFSDQDAPADATDVSFFAGRECDTAPTDSGLWITPGEVDGAFVDLFKGLVNYQFLVRRNDILVKLVPRINNCVNGLSEIAKRTRQLFGARRSIEIGLADSIMPGPSGKYSQLSWVP